ncbi:MAG: hypothetical protein VB015_04095 [Erysipelotrichaceae bacterium]|nr:hypothetical protein [Erysipelotrichaceae bacterium]
MKKSLIVLPVMLLLLGACVGPNPGSSSEPNPSSSEPTPSSSEPTPSSSEEPTSSSEPVVDVQTIAQVRALSAEGAVTIEGNVVAKNEKGFILADATGFILVFLGSAPTQGIGDFVRVAGTTSMYQGARQITNNPLPTITAGEGTNPHAGLGTAAQMTKAQWDAFDMASNVPTYITGVATVFASGTYYNFHFAGIGETGAASLPGSIAYAPAELNFAVAANVDKAYTFTGLLIGTSVSGGAVVRQNILVTSFAPVQSGGESSSEPTSSEPGSSDSSSEPTDVIHVPAVNLCVAAGAETSLNLSNVKIISNVSANSVATGVTSSGVVMINYFACTGDLKTTAQGMTAGNYYNIAGNIEKGTSTGGDFARSYLCIPTSITTGTSDGKQYIMDSASTIDVFDNSAVPTTEYKAFMDGLTSASLGVVYTFTNVIFKTNTASTSSTSADYITSEADTTNNTIRTGTGFWRLAVYHFDYATAPTVGTRYTVKAIIVGTNKDFTQNSANQIVRLSQYVEITPQLA